MEHVGDAWARELLLGLGVRGGAGGSSAIPRPHSVL
jgi:hypothetical protein